jgi:hypothetical protein
LATSLPNLAALYKSQGRYGEAEPLYRRSLAILLQSLGADHPNTETVRQNFCGLIKAMVQAGQTAQLSEQPLTQALLAKMQTEHENA